jgi:hypothetical protein
MSARVLGRQAAAAPLGPTGDLLVAPDRKNEVAVVKWHIERGVRRIWERHRVLPCVLQSTQRTTVA